MTSYQVTIGRTSEAGSLASCKTAQIVCDTSVQGRDDAFNPAELFLASICACMIKGIERATPILKFALAGVEIRVEATRQDNPPKITAVSYEIVVDTTESDHRLDLLHRNVRRFGTISNTVAEALQLEGTIRKRTSAVAAAV
jgi:uncharacterized OsmC-like protein